MNIDEMPAGREIDALIAEKLMRLQVRMNNNGDLLDVNGYEFPSYSTDIAAAWKVLYLFENGTGADAVHLNWVRAPGQSWTCVFRSDAVGHGETAPLAICRAALKQLAADS